MADSTSVSLIIMVYSGFILIVAGGAFAMFLGQVTSFKSNMRSILSDLGDGSQFRTFTAATGAELQGIFGRIPALAFCFQSYFQALIPPQPPYDQYYRSGREAAQTFDRDFILKTSLGLRVFNALPSILVSLGTLGTIAGLALSIYSAQPLLAQADAKSLGEMVTMLFDVGGKAFWPAGIAIFAAVTFLIVERIQTSESSDMIQAVTIVLDSGLTPHTIEQIASTSLTELRMTHKSLVEFTSNYFQTLHSTVGSLISKNGQTVEELLNTTATKYIVPMHQDLSAFRSETAASFESIRHTVTDVMGQLFQEIESTRALLREELARTRGEVGNHIALLGDNMVTNISRIEESICEAVKILHDGQDILRNDVLSKLDWMRAEVDILAQGMKEADERIFERLLGTLGDASNLLKEELEHLRLTVSTEFANIDIPALHMRTANIAHNLAGIHEVVTGNVAETRSLRDSFGDYSKRASSEWESMGEREANRSEQWRQHENDWRNETAVVRNVLSDQLAAQAELTQTLLAQLRDSSQIMAADLHQTTKIMEEVVSVDMGKQTKLLEAIHDRVGMQSNHLSEAIVSVGEDISHRVDLVATVLVGEGIAGDAELSPFLGEVREKLHKWAPEITYNDMRTRLKDYSVDKRVKEGEEKRAVGRADSEGTRRLEARTGLVQRVSQIHSEVQENAQKVESLVREDITRVSSSLKTQTDALHDQVSSVRGQVDSVRGQVDSIRGEISSVSGEVGHKLEDLVERMSRRIDKMGRRMDARMDELAERVASISDQVTDELHVIGDEVGSIASNVDMRRIDRTIDTMAEELRGISGYLEEMPLSSIKVVNMRKAMLKPRRNRPSAHAEHDDDEDVISYEYDGLEDHRSRRPRERLARPGSTRRRGRAS